MRQWPELTGGTDVGQYRLLGLAVVQGALLGTGLLPRRAWLPAVAVLPALAVDRWSWPLAGHPEALTTAASPAAVAVLLAPGGAVLGRSAPSVGRTWRRLLRPSAEARPA